MEMNPDRIDDFLDGHLSENEQLQFIEEIEKNKDLKELVEEKRAIRNMVSSHLSAKETREYLDGITLTEDSRSFYAHHLWKIAAALITVLAVAGIIVQREHSNSAIASRHYFEPFTNDVRGDANSKFQERLHLLWHAGHYDALIKLVEQEATNTDTYASYLQAHSYFKLEQFAQAATTFEQITQNSRGIYSENAEWQLILLALEQHNESDAQNRLQAILQQENHTYFDAARELKSDLDSGWRRFTW